MNGPIFLDSYVKGLIFLTSWYMHIFFAQRFFEAAYPLGITWIDYHICVITSKKRVQKIKGQYMNRSTFWMIKYMNGSDFSKARYMNRVGFEILARTPVPKLPLSYHPPPPPPPPREYETTWNVTCKVIRQRTMRDRSFRIWKLTPSNVNTYAQMNIFILNKKVLMMLLKRKSIFSCKIVPRDQKI